MSLTTTRRTIAAAVSGLVAAPLALLATASPAAAEPVEVTIVGTNDFHGRLIRDRFGIPGAAFYAGAVNSIRAENPNTLFAAAGDLIGATTFESFINEDKPTIDVLNEMGLDVSAVGNHELDKGWDDLTKRVMQPASEANPNGGALWEYIAANLIGPAGEEQLIEDSWVTQMGGADIGFVGAITEDLPTLVNPDGIQGVQVTDVVDAVNTEADRLVAEEGADLVVMLVHEGSPRTDCADAPDSKWGQIVNGVNGNVGAIISGHTHTAYNCTLPKPSGGTRPVVSAGQYGSFLNKLDFVVDPEAGTATVASQELIDVFNGGFTADPEVQAIVDQAVADAEGPGSVPLGDIAAAFKRAYRPAPTQENPDAVAENRGGESSIGNEVAEVQRWATDTQIAFMNAGGLRTDMDGNNEDGYPAELTYKQAAVVQPFANTLVTMDMTGAQIESLLEQQWRSDGSFLKLGVSDGFEYTYTPGDPQGEVDQMSLNGEAIVADQTYRVAANSFIAAGGDSYSVFNEATDKRDSGQVDLEAMVDYMERFASRTPLAPDFAQRAVGVTWPAEAPASYATGDVVSVDLSSLAMTGPGDVQDRRLQVRFDGRRIGSVPVDNTVAPAVRDENGTATVDVALPRYAGDPDAITFVGRRTGTRLTLPIATEQQPKVASSVSLERRPDRVVRGETSPRIKVRVTSDEGTPTGKVVVRVAGSSTREKLNDRGRATVKIGPFSQIGKKTVTVRYLGDDLTRRSSEQMTFRVRRR